MCNSTRTSFSAYHKHAVRLERCRDMAGTAQCLAALVAHHAEPNRKAPHTVRK